MALQGTLDLSQFRVEDGSETRRRRVGLYRGPTAYSNVFTNGGVGDPITPGDLKLGQIHLILFSPGVTSGGTVIAFPVYMLAAQTGLPFDTIVWFAQTTGSERTNGIDLSQTTVVFEAIGL